jgi:hypothetical protein
MSTATAARKVGEPIAPWGPEHVAWVRQRVKEAKHPMTGRKTVMVVRMDGTRVYGFVLIAKMMLVEYPELAPYAEHLAGLRARVAEAVHANGIGAFRRTEKKVPQVGSTTEKRFRAKLRQFLPTMAEKAVRSLAHQLVGLIVTEERVVRAIR